MVGRGSEDAVGRGLVDVVDPVSWLVRGGGSKDRNEQLRSKIKVENNIINEVRKH